MKKIRIVLLNVMILIAIVTALVMRYKYITTRYESLIAELNLEYAAIQIEQQVQDKIVSIDHPYSNVFKNDDPSHAYVQLGVLGKRRLKVGTELTRELRLDSVLARGDSLVKLAGSDTLCILKLLDSDTSKYFFRLMNDNGFPLEKTKLN